MANYQQLAEHVPAPGQTPDWAWFLHAIPELVLLEATPQDPYYHAEGNVWVHTRMVIDALMAGQDFIDGSDHERFVLFYAALLHDIAKPATTVIDAGSGRIGQPGHSKRGAIDARIVCWRAGFHWDEGCCPWRSKLRRWEYGERTIQCSPLKFAAD